jgi:hypothetical protein
MQGLRRFRGPFLLETHDDAAAGKGDGSHLAKEVRKGSGAARAAAPKRAAAPRVGTARGRQSPPRWRSPVPRGAPRRGATRVAFTNQANLPTGCVDLSHLKKYGNRPGPPYPGNLCRGVILLGNAIRVAVQRQTERV